MISAAWCLCKRTRVAPFVDQKICKVLNRSCCCRQAPGSVADVPQAVLVIGNGRLPYKVLQTVVPLRGSI